MAHSEKYKMIQLTEMMRCVQTCQSFNVNIILNIFTIHHIIETLFNVLNSIWHIFVFCLFILSTLRYIIALQAF